MVDPEPGEDRAAALIGRVLSERYRLDALIAKGSMGAVYRGYHLKMRKEVAIKVLHPETENFPELVARFEREAVVGAHLAHPNIAVASDMGTFDGGSYFLVLEYVRGSTLRELMDREAPLAPERAVRIMRQLASALAALNDSGIVHRDLKPPNIMVTAGAEERVKVLDFGLARVPPEMMAPVDESAPVVTRPKVDLAADIARDLLAAAKSSDLPNGAANLIALADVDDKALAKADVRAAALTIAIDAEEKGSDRTSEVYYALAYKFGAAGLDLLYDIGQAAGSPKAARRAAAIIELQGATARASPALRALSQLKKAGCRQKPLLLSQAARDGDRRTLDYLETLRPPTCDPDAAGVCCFRRHVGLEKAIEALRASFPDPAPTPSPAPSAPPAP